MNSDTLRFLRSFDWCSITGRIWWKAKVGESFNMRSDYPCDALAVSFNKRYEGKDAFFTIGNHGYRKGSFDNKEYLAHRVLWLLEYGDWPYGMVDHVNGDRLDNRLVNLRSVNTLESSRNIGIRKTSKSGCHGVTWRKDTNKWTSRITVNSKVIILGDYENLDDAILIRKEAEVKYGFHKNHGRTVT